MLKTNIAKHFILYTKQPTLPNKDQPFSFFPKVFTNQSLSLSMMKLVHKNQFTFSTFTTDFISSINADHSEIPQNEPH